MTEVEIAWTNIYILFSRFVFVWEHSHIVHFGTTIEMAADNNGKIIKLTIKWWTERWTSFSR